MLILVIGGLGLLGSLLLPDRPRKLSADSV
jgi:hypothetical protein